MKHIFVASPWWLFDACYLANNPIQFTSGTQVIEGFQRSVKLGFPLKRGARSRGKPIKP